MCQGEIRGITQPSECCHVQRVARLLAQPLSLRFNHEEFWDGLYSVPKLLVVAVSADSGALFERRVALGSAGEAAFGPSGRSSASFAASAVKTQAKNLHRAWSYRLRQLANFVESRFLELRILGLLRSSSAAKSRRGQAPGLKLQGSGGHVATALLV